jgi:hypothetical protein
MDIESKARATRIRKALWAKQFRAKNPGAEKARLQSQPKEVQEEKKAQKALAEKARRDAERERVAALEQQLVAEQELRRQERAELLALREQVQSLTCVPPEEQASILVREYSCMVMVGCKIFFSLDDQFQRCKHLRLHLIYRLANDDIRVYRSIQLSVADKGVVYAGSAPFQQLVSSVGGTCTMLSERIVHDIRMSGPSVIDPSRWEGVNYHDEELRARSQLYMCKLDWETKGPPVRARTSWFDLREQVRFMVASMIGVDPSTIKDEDIVIVLTKLGTGISFPQPPHQDYSREYLRSLGDNKLVFFAVFPLSTDGMMLQVWESGVRGPGKLVFLPHGSLLVLPGDTIHGGGLMTALSGNIRAHLYIYVQLGVAASTRAKQKVLTGSDLKVEYRCNTTGMYQPAVCLAESGLVRAYGVYRRPHGHYFIDKEGKLDPNDPEFKLGIYN